MKKIIFLLSTFCILFFLNTNVYAAVPTYPWDDEYCMDCYSYSESLDSDVAEYISIWHKYDDIRKKLIYIEDDSHFIYLSESESYFMNSRYVIGDDHSSAKFYNYYDEYGKHQYVNYKVTVNGVTSLLQKETPYPLYLVQEYPVKVFDLYADITYKTVDDFVNDLGNYDSLTDYFNAKDEELNKPEIPDGYLPPLSYRFSSKTALGFPNLTQPKNTVKWNYTEEEIYEQNPGAYAVEMLVSGHFKESVPGSPVNTTIIDTSNTTINNDCKFYLSSNIAISKNEYSFRVEDTGKKLYKMAGAAAFNNAVQPFFLYIRTKEISGSKVSYWKCYKVYYNGAVERVDISYDKDGKSAELPDDEKDPEGEGIDYDYDGYTDDSSTDADNDPSSDLYDNKDEVSVKNVLNNLKSIVNTLGGITELLSKVAGWLPSDIVTLIGIGIGFIVVVGIVKWLL